MIVTLTYSIGAPEQRYWQNRETANVGLDSSVGRAPARQSGGRRFKSRSSQFVFVHPNLQLLQAEHNPVNNLKYHQCLGQFDSTKCRL